MTYADRSLTCVDCGQEFIHTADDQRYYAEKGFSSDPKRCVSCRASRRAARDTGYSASDLGGPRGAGPPPNSGIGAPGRETGSPHPASQSAPRSPARYRAEKSDRPMIRYAPSCQR